LSGSASISTISYLLLFGCTLATSAKIQFSSPSSLWTKPAIKSPTWHTWFDAAGMAPQSGGGGGTSS
jgi:hypothetical protein